MSLDYVFFLIFVPIGSMPFIHTVAEYSCFFKYLTLVIKHFIYFYFFIYYYF